jgi:hypothetical protein
VVAFDFDVRGFIEAETAAGFPAEPGDGPSFLIVFRGGDDRNPVLVDDRTVRILALADGTRTAASIAGELAGDSTDDIRRATDWIEHLFQVGLIGLRSGDPGGEVRAAGDQPG